MPTVRTFQVRKRFTVHLEKVLSEFIIEPKTDASPPRKGAAAEKQQQAAAAKRKAENDAAKAVAAKKKPPPRPSLPFLTLPFKLWDLGQRHREQHYREKLLLDKLSPGQLRQVNS